MNRDEMLLIYDGNLNEIGSELRSKIHREGLLHKVVHCWILGEEDNEKWIYFQQRSYDKKDFPGLYDISAAGHLNIGEEADLAVKRETYEEIGIVIDSKNLKYIGSFKEKMQLEDFYNNEICEVYYSFVENPKFKLGPEVEKMVRISLFELNKLILNDSEKIEAFTMDSKLKLSINKEEFCVHEKQYLKYIIEYMEKL